MTTKKIWSILMFPIVILVCLTIYHYYMSSIEVSEVMMPVGGYDPRDLISGHYLRFKIKFKGYKSEREKRGNTCYKKPYVCLETNENGYVINDYAVEKLTDCRITMKRICKRKELDRFYVPEEYARVLDLGLKNTDNAWIKLAISRDGTPYVKSFYIDGLEWDKFAWKVKAEGGIYNYKKKIKKRRGSR